MFFEDEKDIIREGAEIHIDEDGTVTWEDVLSDDDDIIVLDNEAPNSPAKVANKPKAEVELASKQTDDDVDEEELTKILSKSKQKAPKAAPTSNEDDDFDLDSKLADAALEDDDLDDIEPSSRGKKEAEKKKTVSPVLLILLVVGLIAVAGVYGSQYLSGNEMLSKASKPELDYPSTPQRQMDNITEEDLEQRQRMQEEAQRQAQMEQEAQAQQQEDVPVVNEQEADQLEAQKKEEEKLKEKKQVVQVVPTGRNNPFMPIDKYIKTEVPEASIMFDESGIPTPPDTYGEKSEEITKLMSIAVSGIMYDNIKPSAIITYDGNDYFVQKGDKLDDYRVIEIGKTYVTISLGNNVYRANIGEEFKINTKMYGIADYIPQKQGGGKHYYTVSNEEVYSSSRGNNNDLRYTSEEDITINAR